MHFLIQKFGNTMVGGLKQSRIVGLVTLESLLSVHSKILRLHFQPFGSTPTTLSRAERGASHVT